MFNQLKISFFVMGLFISQLAYGAGIDPQTISVVQEEWAMAKYHLTGDAQHQAFEELLAKLDDLEETYPDDSNLKVWKATTLSTFGSVKGGLGGMKLASKAKEMLEEVLENDDINDPGLAYGVLGTLYYKVPKWPVGFKNVKKAEKLLSRGIELEPHSIDANFYMGEFLQYKKKAKEAQSYFLAAVEAPENASRFVAESARREEASKSLAAMLSS